MTSANSNLIPVTARDIGGASVQTCSARELHAYLGIAQDFNKWLTVQIERAALTEGVDYLYYQEVGKSEIGRPAKECALTLDAGKNIAMLSQTPKGKEVRQYFIECEKRALAPSNGLDTLPPEQRALVQLMVEQAELKRRQAATEDKVKRIEAKQQAFEEGSKFFTIIGYAVWRGFPSPTLQEASALGKKAAKLSKERNILVDKVRDPRFGRINAYHESVLEEIFKELTDDLC